MIYISYLYPLYMSVIDVAMMCLLKARHLGIMTGFWIFPLTMAIYAIQPIFFYFGLSFKTMGILNILWNAISSILVAIAGVYFFGEKLTQNDCIGITLCISGILLLGID